MQRLLAACVQLAVLLIVTAACGAAPAPSDDVALAVAATKEAGSARVETTVRVSYGWPVETHEFRSTELVDYRTGRRSRVDGQTGCRTITIGDDFYVELPAVEGRPAGRHWVKSGSEDAGEAEALFEQSREEEHTTNADGSAVQIIVGVAVPQRRPDEYLDYLREQADEPERVGEEDVHGVPTTRYRAELDRAQLTRKELQAAGWKEVNIERYLQDLVDVDEQIEIWVDADGLVRRTVTTEMPRGGELGSIGGSVTTTEYFDFGVEVDVEAPPASAVIDSEEWQRLTEERMQAELDTLPGGEDGTEPLPGSFEPSSGPSCLH